MGSSSMKNLERTYFWWSAMDKEIKIIKQNCDNCLDVRQNPPKSIISPWNWPENPWTRVHCNCIGPFPNKYFFCYSGRNYKMVRIFQVNSMTQKLSFKNV